MKIRNVCLVTALLCAANLGAQTADELVLQGRQFLSSSNLPAAYSRFTNALALAPNHQAANVLAAATRILLIPRQPACSNFLTRLGLPAAGRNLYDWTADFRRTTNGDVILPPNLYSAEGIRVVSNAVIPTLRQSLENLAKVTSPGFLLPLTASETAIEPVTIDYGDVLLARAFLHAAEGLGHTLNAHNFNIWINQLEQMGKADTLTIQSLLAAFPNLLTQNSKAELLESRASFTNAIHLYFAASDFIRNARTNGAQRLFNLDPEDAAEEARFRENLTTALASVFKPVMVETNDDHYVYAGAYFAGTKSLRSLLPKFNGDSYVPNSLPDYTLGGVLIGESVVDIEKELRRLNPPRYPGLYAGRLWGENGGGGYQIVGVWGLFVNTNLQATLLGFDGVRDRGFYQVFKLDREGEWEFVVNNVRYWGEIWSDGGMEGEIYALDGSWRTRLEGERQPDQGPFQAVAGYYFGSWTLGLLSGKLRGMVTAEGNVGYVEFDSTGAIGDAGGGMINPTTLAFVSTSMGGTEVQGTLNPTLRRLSGSVRVPGMGTGGTFVMDRVLSVPSEVPPTILSAPQNQVVQAGGNATFSVRAAGSLPLSYQWYSNGVQMLLATKSSLVLSNVQQSMSGVTYSVTVRNLVGETNASATLTVVPEATRPTLTLLAPLSGQKFINPAVQVSGVAKDNVQVSNVFFQVKNYGWLPASTSDNWLHWTGTAMLDPGTNVISAYAVDTSGNVSPTSKVSVIYVPTDRLIVQTTGAGKVSPNYSNAVLQVGRSYSITALPGSGQMFSNWIGGVSPSLTLLTNGPTLKFTMVSNLVLQANFVPNYFLGAKGYYYGLFAVPGDRQHESSGFLTLYVNESRAYSASLATGGKKYSLSGKFEVDGTASKSISRGLTLPPLNLALALDLSPGADRLTGTVSDGTWTAGLLANRAVFNATTNRATRFAGRYTLVFPGPDGDPAVPMGDGYGAVTVASSGTITLSGSLADGTAVSQAAPISKDGLWPLYASLYSGKGSVWSWVQFDANQPAANLQGQVSWVRPPIPASRYYPAGFTNVVLAEGSRITAPANRTTRVINVTNGAVVFEGGNLAAAFTNLVELTEANKVIGPASNRMSFVLNVTNGVFSGNVVTPDRTRTNTFKGAILQDLDTGHGYFLGTNQSGRVTFGPAP